MSEYGEASAGDAGRRTGWAELPLGGRVELARPLARLGARILDFVSIGVVIGLALIVFNADADVDDFAADISNLPSPWVWGPMVAVFLYDVIFIALWGQTVGKRMVGIKVINATSGDVPGWGKAFGRWFIPFLSSLIPVVGPLLALVILVSLTWDRVYQGWHDKAAGTLVIKA